MARTTDTHERREPKSFTLAPHELAMLEKIREERGDDSLSATVRSLREVWIERQAMLATALEHHVRGRFTADELRACLDAMNGTLLDHDAGDGEMLGQHIAANLEDTEDAAIRRHGADPATLRARLRDMHPNGAIALELWCADMWRHSDDPKFWDKMIEILAKSPVVGLASDIDFRNFPHLTLRRRRRP